MAENEQPADAPTSGSSGLAEREDTARTAGRGGLFVAGAKVYFILMSFAQQTLLTRVLGADGYGALSRVLAIANVADNVVVSASIQGASRVVAEAKPGELAGAQRGVLRIHGVLAPAAAILFAIVAPVIAIATGARHVVPHVLVASLVVLGYSLYAPFVGVLNGQRKFARQALLDTTYATIRTIAMLGGGLLLRARGHAALGAVAGFAGAALLIVPLAVRAAGVGHSGPGAPKRSTYLLFLAPLALGQFFLNALMQIDITLLGYFASEATAKAGLVGDVATATADRSVAIYRACQLFSFLPYQLLVSITFILFPMLAKAHGEGDAESVKTYVRTGMRLAMVLTGGMVAVVSGLAPGLLHLVFKPEIADIGGPTLRMLAIGQGAFALYAIETTILSSVHRERWTMMLNAFATLLVVVAAFVLVPGASVGEALSERAAVATSVALFAALVLGSIGVLRATGALVPPLSALRVLVAFAITAYLPQLVPIHGKLATLALGPALGVVYLVTLVLTRELGASDLALVTRVLRRKAS
jgi:stage V sporulation protein B